jgi:DNA-binding NarL/FixJ family response regulator
MRSRTELVPYQDVGPPPPLVRPRRPEEGLRELPPVARRFPAPQSVAEEAGMTTLPPRPRVLDVPSDPSRPLTDRDLEVLRLLAVGRSTGQIAAAMLVSTNTTRTRIRRLQGKLSAADRHTVVRVARGLDLG